MNTYKPLKPKWVCLNSYYSAKTVEKALKCQKCSFRASMGTCAGLDTIFIIFLTWIRHSLKVFTLNFMKSILFLAHEVSSFSYSKIQLYQDLMISAHFNAFYPRQRSKFLTDENFCNLIIWYIIGTAMKWYTSVLMGRISVIDFSHISLPYRALGHTEM